MRVTIKLTYKQLYLIQNYIIDLCNVEFKSKIENYTELSTYYKYDQYRIQIYHKLKGNTIENSTLDEINFIIKEMEYWIFDFERDTKEKIVGRQIISKLIRSSKIEDIREARLK